MICRNAFILPLPSWERVGERGRDAYALCRQMKKEVPYKIIQPPSQASLTFQPFDKFGAP